MSKFFRDIEEEYNIWNNYCNKFDLLQKDIKYKYEHSLRVAAWCYKIKPDKLSKLIGLYHDIARFSQFTKFHTYNDLISLDHGFEGAKITEELLKDNSFFIENKSIITTAIKFHNALNILNNLTEKELEYLNILRDADKLDILNTLSIGKHRRFNYSDNDLNIRQSVNDDFFNHSLVKNTNFKDNDRNNQEECIQILAYCYDLKYSFNIVYPIINNMYKTLPSNYKIYLDEIINYIKEKE